MSDIFKEVAEDVRRERYIQLWRKYGKYVVGAVSAVVLVIVAIVGWREYQVRMSLARGERFMAAVKVLESGAPERAAEAFAALAEDTGAGYGALARLRQAEALAAAGHREGAVAVYDRLAADGSVDPAFRQLAALMAVIHLMDVAAPNELAERLQPLAADDSPWRFTARELLGVLALSRGDHEEARTVFTGILEDRAAPARTRVRAAEFLGILGESPAGGG
ncbi:MAG: tetratricopeptide repeat protein [Alphaproteobacteria bacterium]